MKKNAIFERCLSKVSPETQAEVQLNIDIANRIDDLLKAKGMTQRDLARLMNKQESEISRWLSGTHGFTTKTLAKITSVLSAPIITIKGKEKELTTCPINTYVSFPQANNQPFHINKKNNTCSFKYTIN